MVPNVLIDVDVLEEVELFVRTGSPEVITLINDLFFLGFAFLVKDGDTTLFTEGWIR